MKTLSVVFFVCLSFIFISVSPIFIWGNSSLEEYKSEVLVQAKVGPKENEFGLKEGYEIQTLGVSFFTVSPSGGIYIYDRAKRDIKQFSPTGEFDRAISLEKIYTGDLKVDPDGKIYSLYDREYPGEERYFIYQLSPEGKLLTTIKVLDIPEIGYLRTDRFPDGRPAGLVSLYLVNKDVYLYDWVNGKSLPVIKNGKILESSQSIKEIFEGRLTTIGSKWRFNLKGGIELYDKKGKLIKHILADQGSFIDSDDQGNFYFYDPKGLDKGKGVRRIFKFDQDGNLKAIVERSSHHYAECTIKSRCDIVISSDGIYVLNNYKDRVEVIKYSPISQP